MNLFVKACRVRYDRAMHSIRIAVFAFGGIGLALTSSARGIVIVPTFVDSPDQAWTDDEKAVVNLAIQNWENRILDNQTVNFTFDFTHDDTVDNGG